jgi:hypothetical protein
MILISGLKIRLHCTYNRLVAPPIVSPSRPADWNTYPTRARRRLGCMCTICRSTKCTKAEQRRPAACRRKKHNALAFHHLRRAAHCGPREKPRGGVNRNANWITFDNKKCEFDRSARVKSSVFNQPDSRTCFIDMVSDRSFNLIAIHPGRASIITNIRSVPEYPKAEPPEN